MVTPCHGSPIIPRHPAAAERLQACPGGRAPDLRCLRPGRRRRELAALFSWSIPTEPALAALAGLAPLVECGAGMGYWTALLRARGWSLTETVELPNWPGLRDRLMVYRRNPVRRPHRRRDRCDECGRFVATGSIGRCDRCFERRPPALALWVGRHRIEYPPAALETMPAALRKAFESSPSRIR
jgi:hypothetical protein